MSKNLNKSMGNKNDELYTPKILVDVIAPYYEKFADKFYKEHKRYPVVWCPFDTMHSEFVYLFREMIVKSNPKIDDLIYTHIAVDNGDFFKLIDSLFIDKIDVVISNPPFSKKLEVFKKLNEKGIPFALLCNTEALNYQEIGGYFCENGMSFIIPDKKVSFNGKTSSFNTSYFCSPSFFGNDGDDGIKHSTIEFVHLEHNNTKKNYQGSRMYEDFPK